MSGQTGTLGKYQIIREIARSNDIVYEAYDPIMNRRVALKELAVLSGSTDQQKDDRRTRFLREARAAGTLTHPNIVTIYEYGEEASRHYIAMEFLDGHTLRNEIDTHGFLPTDRAIEITVEILEALDYAHSHGVIHRDIKPDNVQLLPDGRIKITDFGIARLTFEPNLTIDGQVFGTPSYMSPEQVVGKEIDARSDLFSVGVLLYEMVAGKKPFGGDSVVSITYAIMNTTPDQPSQANWALWQVIERALDKSVQLRHASAKEMISALNSVQRGAQSVVQDPSPAFGMPNAMQPPSMAPPPNNPYVGNPYLNNPYGSPPPPIPNSAPGTYAYNPFGSGHSPPIGYPQNPQMPTGSYVPPPVYYPPPPRAPLMRPESKQFFGKLMLSILVLGTFFGLVIVLVTTLSTAFQRDASMRQDAAALDQLQAAVSRSTDEAIATYEATMPKLKDSVNRSSAMNQLAVLYERKGKEFLRSRDYVRAEEWFKKAAETDRLNAAYPSDLGELYSVVASQESNASQRLVQREESATQWAQAVVLEKSDAVRQSEFKKAASVAYVELANENRLSGYNDIARSALLKALSFVEPGSPEALTIQNQIDGL
jgi:serine/threonine-protein kinase